jgi:hypothetical protein
MERQHEIAKRLKEIFDLAGSGEGEVAAIIDTALESHMQDASIDDFVKLFRSMGFPEREHTNPH